MKIHNPVSGFKSAARAIRTFLLLIVAITSVWTSSGSTDYAPAIYREAYPGHWYTSGYGKHFYVIHDMEGYYWGTIYWFQRSTVYSSVHYCTNGKKDTASDAEPGGEVTQMVRDAYYAWHALCWNQHSMGTEHEGFASNPAWYTEAQYVSSASITKAKTTKYGLTKDRNRVIAHGQKSVSSWVTWMRNQGWPDSFTLCQNHTDPGPYWAWSHYMDLVNGTTSTPSAPSGLALTVVSSSQINLTWVDNSSTETGFSIYRSTDGVNYTWISSPNANIRSYSSTGLSPNTRYYYKLVAQNAAGYSGFSNVASAVTASGIPPAPTSLVATAVSDSQINLTWVHTAVGESGFSIYRSTDNVTFTWIATAGINATSYSNTGLTGNRRYYYKIAANSAAGYSPFSNTANDITAPQAPSALAVNVVAGTANWNKLALTWTDNSNAEVGFKMERGTALAGPFSQIATNAAGVNSYTDSGLAATTTYYYRVRSYNANGNSAYSAVVSRATPNAPPLLSAIGNKSVIAGSPLTFTAAASDPNATTTTTTWQNFTTFPHMAPAQTVLFNNPNNSPTTTNFLDTSVVTSSQIFTNGPSVWGAGNKSLRAYWSFKTGTVNPWIRLNTFNTPTNPNPTIALDQKLQFKYYATVATKVAIGVRETGTAAAYGANGGTTGPIEWVGVTNVVGGAPIPNRLVAAVTSTTLAWDIPFDPQAAFTGDGSVPQNNIKGVLEHIVLKGEGGAGIYGAYFDDFQIVAKNNNAFTLDTGSPAGATIGYRTGKFAWTPTTGQAGVHTITIRVTDRLGGVDFETINVTVTGTGNAAPVLAAIGNKAVNEGVALTFTATATDADTAQTKTFTLDAGNPSGSSINASSGAFTWTPSESQGPGSYPITVRVTDNGSPVSNDFETISVAVNEVNVAPVLAAIANQTVNEGSTLNLTASATDADLPANTLTYSIAGPIGMTINSSSGAISYTPGEDDGGDVNQVTVTARDNGNPVLSAARSFNVTVAEVNNAPVLALATIKVSSSPVTDFESDEDGSYNGTTMFRYPTFSSSTSAFIDPANDFNSVTENYPDRDVNTSAQVLYLNVGFKTGTVNPWCRFTTYATGGLTNAYDLPNPTIDLTKHLRFKVWTDRSIKIGVGIRETGTSMPIGANGGAAGSIEWAGVTGLTGTAPNPSRIIMASNWTTLDFNLPLETITTFTGDGVLASGKGALEHLVLVPNAGMGSYNIYFDDFEVVDISTSLTVDAGGTITLTNSATDSDLPAQQLTFSLGAGAPTNANINSASGVFTWSPHGGQAPSTANIPVVVTDSGVPNASDTEILTIVVNKVNTAPRLSGLPDHLVEITSGETVIFDAGATDDDVPANTLTFSLISPPAGATINSSTGNFSWTPTGGYSTNTIIVRVQDNGTPVLYEEQAVRILVIPTNASPVLSLGNSRVTEPVVTFETFTNNTPNEAVMFKKPQNSGTTLSYIDTAVTNYTRVSTSFPAGNLNAGAKVMQMGWTFKTGTTDYWVRLTTFNATYIPNPAIDASARLKFDLYSTKALKVGVGIRETGTSAVNGANGGTTGTLEWVGVTNIVGTSPQPNRSVAANTWTTLEFNLLSDPKQAFPASGNGVLNGGQQALEHLALVGAGGTGAYTVYVDNFEVVTTPALPGAVAMKANSTFEFTASATDPDPGTGVDFGLDADFVESHPTATFASGAFSWKPGTGEVGVSSITVTAQDNPTNGSVIKSDSDVITVTVSADTLAPQSAGDTFVAGGDSVTLTWDSVAGTTYKIQTKASGAADWSDLQTFVATGELSSVPVASGTDALVRVLVAGASDQ